MAYLHAAGAVLHRSLAENRRYGFIVRFRHIFYISVFNPIASRIAAIKDLSLDRNPGDVGFWFNFDQSDLGEKRRAVPISTKMHRSKKIPLFDYLVGELENA